MNRRLIYVVVFIAVLTGVGGFYFLGQVNSKVKMEVAGFELDMMTDEIEVKVNEFLLYGIEDKARGEDAVFEGGPSGYQGVHYVQDGGGEESLGAYRGRIQRGVQQ